MLVEKLRTARKSAGLSLRELQAKIGNAVSAQAIGKYERGEMRPGREILDALASALGVSIDYLISEEQIKLGAIEFRENFIRSKKEEAQIEAKILSHVRNYLEIEEILQVDTIEWDQPREFPFIVKDHKDVELAAHKLRDDWKLGSDPIPHLAEFLEDRGIKVIFLALPESVAGVTCFVHRERQKYVPTIVINDSITVERQRFTLAHELGHLVLENKSTIDKENICNRFASAFIMPDRILWATLGKNRRSISLGELVSLKLFFGVSIQAIVYRCKDLDIINKTTYQYLYRSFAIRGWLKPPYHEPGVLKPETYERFQRLCFRALAEEMISPEKAAELLGTTIDQVSTQMNYS
jgi:Zn-dependent peptidase ImmA (M78 family)